MVDSVEIISAKLVNGELHIVKRERSNIMNMSMPPHPVPDKVWKEVYCASIVPGDTMLGELPIQDAFIHDGIQPEIKIGLEITLKETIKGRHYPAKKIKEAFSFED